MAYTVTQSSGASGSPRCPSDFLLAQPLRQPMRAPPHIQATRAEFLRSQCRARCSRASSARCDRFPARTTLHRELALHYALTSAHSFSSISWLIESSFACAVVQQLRRAVKRKRHRRAPSLVRRSRLAAILDNESAADGEESALLDRAARRIKP